jgi:Tfp pilus assembly protein PilV
MKTKINIKIRNQLGSSLLETMVSLFVLAIGLLGTLAMQTKSIQHNQNSYSYSQAIVMATDINERLRITEPANTAQEVNSWVNDVRQNLPRGAATIVPNARIPGGAVRTINISFSESAAGELSAKTRTITFRTWF